MGIVKHVKYASGMWYGCACVCIPECHKCNLKSAHPSTHSFQKDDLSDNMCIYLAWKCLPSVTQKTQDITSCFSYL